MELTKKNEIANQIFNKFIESKKNKIFIICIGTDLIIYDSFGPLAGTMINNKNFKYIKAHGSLNNLVHGKNIEYLLPLLNKMNKNNFIIGLDACIGEYTSVYKKNEIFIKNKGILPGAGIGKNLPRVGNISISSITLYQNELSGGVRLGPIYDSCKDLVDILTIVNNLIKEYKHNNKIINK